jgi:hypothetical protein
MPLFRSKFYRPLEPMRPLSKPGALRLPDIDMTVMNGEHFPTIEKIARQSSQRAAEMHSRGEPPPPTVQALEDVLVSGFSMPKPSVASDVLRVWTLNGCAIAHFEEESGAARRGKSERHYAAAIALRRGETPR